MTFASFKESATTSEIEMTATLELKYKERENIEGKYTDVWYLLKCYHGKSTRRVTRKKKSEDELIQQKVEMEEEAKKAALMECFRERLGFTEFNDMVFDELHRPMNV